MTNFIFPQRTSRTNAGRKKFKVDSLLDRLEQKLKESGNQDGVPQGGFMTITFLGYYDSKKSLKYLEGSIPVELSLLKMCHKKRKETPYLMESVGVVEIPCNPSEDHPPNKAPAISVSAESLTTSNGQPVRR
jgi:polycomb protein SUZ12